MLSGRSLQCVSCAQEDVHCVIGGQTKISGRWPTCGLDVQAQSYSFRNDE